MVKGDTSLLKDAISKSQRPEVPFENLIVLRTEERARFCKIEAFG